MNEFDPSFEKPPEPSRPFVSTSAVISVCFTVVYCTFFGFACVQPEPALKMLGGLAFFLTAVFFLALLGNAI